MDKVLIKTRLISFAYGFATLVVLALADVLSSGAFKELVGSTVGTGFFGTFAFLLTTEIVKGLRNLKLEHDAKLGAKREEPENKPFLII